MAKGTNVASHTGTRSCCGALFACCLTVLIYWAVLQPHHIRAAVDSATLSNLTVVGANASSSGAAVAYNLAVGLGLYNPSIRVNIYYDTIDATLRFGDAVIGPAANATSPSEFYQHRKTGEVVKLEFDYGRGVGVGVEVAGELEKAASGQAGTLGLELDVDVRVRYVLGLFKLRQKPKIRCSLSIPVKAEGRGRGGVLASGDRCRVKY